MANFLTLLLKHNNFLRSKVNFCVKLTLNFFKISYLSTFLWEKKLILFFFCFTLFVVFTQQFFLHYVRNHSSILLFFRSQTSCFFSPGFLVSFLLRGVRSFFSGPFLGPLGFTVKRKILNTHQEELHVFFFRTIDFAWQNEDR